jgi:transposase
MKQADVVHIGIDVAKDSLCISTGAHGAVTVPTTPAQIRKALRAAAREAGGRPLHVCFEATGPYTRALAAECRAAGIAHSVLNPHLVRCFAKSMGAAKTDPVDAEMIRRYAGEKRPAPAPEPREAQQRVRRLVTARDAVVKGARSLASVLETLGDTPEGRRIRLAVRHLERQAAALEAEVAGALEADAETAGLAAALSAVKGVGTLTAAAVIAHAPEVGTLGRRGAARLAGLAPVTQKSGPWVGRAKIEGGRKGLRDALYMPATSARRHNPGVRRFYDRLRAAGKPQKVAQAAVMRKLFCHLDAVARAYYAGLGRTPPAQAGGI